MEKGWWSRLTSKPQKPAWLKIDFDRWQSEEDPNEEDVNDIREDYPGLYEQLQREELGYKPGMLCINIYFALHTVLMLCTLYYYYYLYRSNMNILFQAYIALVLSC